jgi:hypothetical protein
LGLGSQELFAWGWPWTVILPSQPLRITGVSHHTWLQRCFKVLYVRLVDCCPHWKPIRQVLSLTHPLVNTGWEKQNTKRTRNHMPRLLALHNQRINASQFHIKRFVQNTPMISGQDRRVFSSIFDHHFIMKIHLVCAFIGH